MLKPDFVNWTTVTNRVARLIALVAFAIPLVAKIPAVQQEPLSFTTPEEAMQATIRAAENNDNDALLKLFGPAARDIVESGDPAEDSRNRAEFVRLANQHVLVQTSPYNPYKTTFFIGAQGWPFPIPLVRINGNWQFDAAQGRAEILAHRIGENESDVIDVCRGFVEAELEYASQIHDSEETLVYAQKVTSAAGKQDGLYWDAAAGS